jgi:hypothetical protein
MEDAHVGNKPTKVMNRDQVIGFEQMLQQQAHQFPQVRITVQQYFSQKAQTWLEDYYFASNADDCEIWTKGWEAVIDVLKRMYPIPEASKITAVSKAKKAMIAWLTRDLEADVPFHNWVANKELHLQVMTLMHTAREIFKQNEIPADEFRNHFKGQLGQEIVTDYLTKLRKVNRTWDRDLVKLIDAYIENKLEGSAEEFSLWHLQDVVKTKISEYDRLKIMTDAAAPDHIGHTSQSQINAIVHANPSPPAKRFYTAGYPSSPSSVGSYDSKRKYSERRESHSGRGRGDYRPRDNDYRRKSTGDLAKYGPSKGSYAPTRNAGVTPPPDKASKRTRDGKNVWNVPDWDEGDHRMRRRQDSPVSSRGSSRSPPTRRPDLRGRERFTAKLADICDGCGKRHPGGINVCAFVIEKHPDANLSGAKWYDCEILRKYQSISSSIRTLEYGKRLMRVPGSELWTTENTNLGPRKPDKASDDYIVLKDSKPNEKIDIHSIFSTAKGSEDDQSGPYTIIDQHPASLLLDSGCLGRDFISTHCIDRLKLYKYPLLNAIEVTSIHGKEIATHAVYLKEFKIQ